MPRADMGFLLSLPTPLSSLHEQRSIVDVLNHTASIRRLRQQAHLAQAEALMESLMARFFGENVPSSSGS